MKRRIQEHIASKGNGNIWEYGMQAFDIVSIDDP